MSTSAVWVARKRERARAAGLCTRCCTRRPAPDRAICAECNASTAERVRRRRQRLRAASQSRRLLVEIEQAGDLANDHYLHADAARYFEDALHIEGISSSDTARISDKLARALALGTDPNSADPWFERVLELNRRDASAERLSEALIMKARQLELDCRTESALPLLHEAVTVSEASGRAHLRKKSYVSMAHFLIALDRVEAARSYLHSVGRLSGKERDFIRVVYYRLWGALFAEEGNAPASCQNFEKAIAAAKRDMPRDMPLVWGAYGASALQLGNVSLAMSCYERALHFARRLHVAWLSQWVCLEYANLLYKLGRAPEACTYLREALSYGIQSALFDTELAKNGVAVAIRANDGDLLRSCITPATMSVALRSGEPDRIAGVAAAFAGWHIANGRRRDAQQILHHVVGKLTSVREVWNFPIAVARYGAAADLPRARSFIARSTSRPNAVLQDACLQLFDAFVSKRQGSSSVNAKAVKAARSFEALGWHGYAELAETLLPTQPGPSVPLRAERDRRGSGAVPLTPRERDVASLAIKGLTNQAIGSTLAISENTVESHMRSILNRLGLQSRHQLREVLSE